MLMHDEETRPASILLMLCMIELEHALRHEHLQPLVAKVAHEANVVFGSVQLATSKCAYRHKRP